MPKVTLNGHVLADSNETIVVENSHYFPPSSVTSSFLTNSDTSSVCPWKGAASYYNANIDGNETKDVAWYYPNPSAKAKKIEGYVAFYKNKVNFE